MLRLLFCILFISAHDASGSESRHSCSLRQLAGDEFLAKKNPEGDSVLRVASYIEKRSREFARASLARHQREKLYFSVIKGRFEDFENAFFQSETIDLKKLFWANLSACDACLRPRGCAHLRIFDLIQKSHPYRSFVSPEDLLCLRIMGAFEGLNPCQRKVVDDFEKNDLPKPFDRPLRDDMEVEMTIYSDRH